MKTIKTLSEKERKRRIMVIVVVTLLAIKYVYPVLKGFIIDLF